MSRTSRSRTSRSVTALVSSVTLLALVVTLVGAAPAPTGHLDGVPDVGAVAPVIDPQLEAELLSTDAVDASAPAIVTMHEGEDPGLLGTLGLTGTRLDALSMLIVDDLGADQLLELSDADGVRSVWAVEQYELLMQESTWVTGAREVWYDEENYGYTGEGVQLGVVDTGADGLHFDFGNLVEACNATLTGTIGGGAGVVCTEPELGIDDNGHGTHVAGTMAGTGAASGGMDDPHSTTGMAPNADIISYKANVGPSLLNTDILAAYDHLIAGKENGDHDIVAINNSFGGGTGSDYSPDDPQAIAYKAANEAGMLPVFAAGNAGPDDNTLGVQCTSPYVLCVGATTKTDGITAFSSVGRPADPHPTDDEVEDDPAAYGNHDRRLARAFDVGVYRPGVVAPGAVINAMSAVGGDPGAATCRVGMPEPTGCYQELQGTSMAAPHVAGAAGLVTEAFREAHGRDPSADELLDILERSAMTLPGHPAEQQGAGRLDVPAAIDLALVYTSDGITEPDWAPVGTPAPRYVEGAHPGGDTLIDEHVGCTGPASFTERSLAGVTTVEVPPGVHELTVEVDWSAYHPEANLYLELFRPGHDPAASEDPPGPTRTFPVAESAGLVHTADPIVDDVGVPATSRSVTFPGPEDGEWSVRVTHRLGATAQPCADDAANTEESEQTVGFSYDVAVHATRATDLPEATFEVGTTSGENVALSGTGRYPDRLEGVTTSAIPGTAVVLDDDDDEVETHDYFFAGPLTGPGTFSADAPGAGAPSTQTALTSLGDPDVPFDSSSIHWTGDFSGTIAGNLHFDWFWASPNPLGGVVDVEVVVSIFADPDPDAEEPAGPVAQQQIRLQVLPDGIGPVRNENTVFVRGSFDETMQIQVTPVFIDTGPGITAVYGSETAPSWFGVPVGDGDGGLGDVETPQNVRVTDLGDALRVAWDPVEDADDYEVHRSTDPAFVPSEATRVAETAGTECRSPDVPSWPGASRDGLCLVDTDVSQGATVYYRVLAVTDGEVGPASLVGYGTPTLPDRQARVQVDRIFGPGYWEDATATDATATSWSHVWDRTGVSDPAEPRARVFSQGVGSLVADPSSDGGPGDPDDPDEPGGPGDPGGPGLPGDGGPRDTDRVCREASTYPNPYSDLVERNAHYRNVLCMTAYGIAQGFRDGTYRPPANVTRDQMATFIANLIELERPLPAAGSEGRFDDVGRESPHWESVQKLALAGVVEGRDRDTYAPRSPVSRDQMASFIARAIDYLDDGEVNGSAPPPGRPARFPDVPVDSVHRAAIESLAEQGIVAGYSDGRYGPRDFTRRDQMASFLMRGYDYVAETRD